MGTTRGLLLAGLALALVVPPAAGGERILPEFGEEIFVYDEAPFVTPVERGRPVVIRFGIGQVEIEATAADEVIADLDVDCDEALSRARCEAYRQRLRLEPRRRGEALEVRLLGLSRWKLRKLHLTGRIGVPRWSPLTVRIGVGDVDIHTAGQDLAVRMGIGDLTVHVPGAAVADVEMATRIGDTSLTEGGATSEGARRLLLGSRTRWSDGRGGAHVTVTLEIGDAEVVLD